MIGCNMHNIARSFKVLVGLVFSAMEHDTHELFCCLAWTATTGKQIVLHKTIKCFQSSWRFLKFSEALHVYSNQNFYACSHVS